MPRDLKHRATYSTPAKTSIGSKILLTGALALLAASVGLSLWNHETLQALKTRLGETLKTTAPQFGYYRSLEDRERRVSEAEIQEDARQIRSGNPSVSGQYTLLVGTYKSKDELESMQKKLRAFRGLGPKSERVQLEFSSWYRVRLGPYGKLQEAVEVRSFLKNQGIDSIIETPLPP